MWKSPLGEQAVSYGLHLAPCASAPTTGHFLRVSKQMHDVVNAPAFWPQVAELSSRLARLKEVVIKSAGEGAAAEGGCPGGEGRSSSRLGRWQTQTHLGRSSSARELIAAHRPRSDSQEPGSPMADACTVQVGERTWLAACIENMLALSRCCVHARMAPAGWQICL